MGVWASQPLRGCLQITAKQFYSLWLSPDWAVCVTRKIVEKGLVVAPHQPPLPLLQGGVPGYSLLTLRSGCSQALAIGPMWVCARSAGCQGRATASSLLNCFQTRDLTFHQHTVSLKSTMGFENICFSPMSGHPLMQARVTSQLGTCSSLPGLPAASAAPTLAHSPWSSRGSFVK